MAMTNSDGTSTRPSDDHGMGAWIGIGAGLGVAFGAIYGNVGLGTALGACFGAVIGGLLEAREARHGSPRRPVD